MGAMVVAIIGMGPRGLTVLERLVSKGRRFPELQLEVHLLDPGMMVAVRIACVNRSTCCLIPYAGYRRCFRRAAMLKMFMANRFSPGSIGVWPV